MYKEKFHCKNGIIHLYSNERNAPFENLEKLYSLTLPTVPCGLHGVQLAVLH
jgi:hypothetical protein